MGLVLGVDAFELIDADECAEGARVDDFLDFLIDGRVAHGVADGDDAVGSLAHGVDGDAIFEGAGHGFLKEHVVAEFHGLESGGDVLAVHGGVDEEIADLADLGEEFRPGAESHIFGDVAAVADPGSAIGERFGDGDDPSEVGVCIDHVREVAPASAAAEDDDFEGIAHGILVL